MRYTLKIARTDRGFTTHKFADLRACYAALDMLRQAGKVRRAWVYDREAAGCYWDADMSFRSSFAGMIYSR